MRKLWPKYENWSKLGKQNMVYRYTSNMYRYILAQNDQNPKFTGIGDRPKTRCVKCVPKCASARVAPSNIVYYCTDIVPHGKVN